MAAAVDMASMLSLHTQQQVQRYEDNMDTFFDFSQGEYHSPTSQSPDTSSAPTSNLDSSVPVQPSEYVEHHQRTYNGPSHEYELFRQQTGLPGGVVPHLAAINGYSAPSQPSDSFNQLSAGYNSGLDFDGLGYAGEGMSSQSYFYPNDTIMEEFIEPGAVDSQPQPPVMRLRPGVHSQQAQNLAQQKQQQQSAQRQSLQQPQPPIQQQQQQRQQLQQQQQQQQPTGMTAQRPLPKMPQQQQQKSLEEPQLNSQISRLLSQMRQGSVGSSHSDASPEADGNEGIPAVQRTRKDEDDMDEDERLLASEEGKKLSSKERRQLRNKVSARAFRSRRKEYISQLEAEVNARTDEASSLRTRNNHLYLQNQQLLQLTQAMLNHSAFDTFMQDLSRNPNMLQQQAQQTRPQTQKAQPQSQQPKSDHAQVPQGNNDIVVGMTRIPEPNLDFSMLNLGANDAARSFAQPAASFADFQTTQIFALHSIPQGPSAADLVAARFASKPELPLIPELSRLGDKQQRESAAAVVTPMAASAAPAKASAKAAPCADLDLYSDAPVCHSATASPSPLPSLASVAKPSFSSSLAKHDTASLMQEVEDLLAPAETTCRVLALLI